MYLVSKNPKRQLTILKQDVENLEKHERFRFIGDSSFLSIYSKITIITFCTLSRERYTSNINQNHRFWDIYYLYLSRTENCQMSTGRSFNFGTFGISNFFIKKCIFFQVQAFFWKIFSWIYCMYAFENCVLITLY